MIKVGIIGTESSHALAFVKYFNCPDLKTGKYRYPSIRVTAVVGDSDSVEEIRRCSDTVTEVSCSEELARHVDAAVITSCAGSMHLAQARPLLQARLPLFIDKPFTADPVEAEELARLIRQSGCNVMGGSGLKYAKGVSHCRKLAMQLRSENLLTSSALHFPTTLDSSYDGMYYYTPHLLELAISILGTDVRKVTAIRNGKNMTALLDYEKDTAALHFTCGAIDTTCIFYTLNYLQSVEIDWSDIYAELASRFARMLLGSFKPEPIENMVLTVNLIHALEQAVQTGQTVELQYLQY